MCLGPLAQDLWPGSAGPRKFWAGRLVASSRQGDCSRRGSFQGRLGRASCTASTRRRRRRRRSPSPSGRCACWLPKFGQKLPQNFGAACPMSGPRDRSDLIFALSRHRFEAVRGGGIATKTFRNSWAALRCQKPTAICKHDPVVCCYKTKGAIATGNTSSVFRCPE